MFLLNEGFLSDLIENWSKQDNQENRKGNACQPQNRENSRHTIVHLRLNPLEAPHHTHTHTHTHARTHADAHIFSWHFRVFGVSKFNLIGKSRVLLNLRSRELASFKLKKTVVCMQMQDGEIMCFCLRSMGEMAKINVDGPIILFNSISLCDVRLENSETLFALLNSGCLVQLEVSFCVFCILF